MEEGPAAEEEGPRRPGRRGQARGRQAEVAATPTVLGVDGCRRGWVTATLSGDGELRLSLHPSFSRVVGEAGTAATIGVDIPIGLPASAYRPADVEARRMLGRHASRVFHAFPRSVMLADTYAEAVAACGDGPKISRQSYALRGKILEVDQHRDDPRIYEVHPELAFAEMARGPLPSKHSWDGVHRRIATLEREGLAIDTDIGAAGVIPVDDVLDAVAVAWSARRIALGRARHVPASPPVDGGRPIAIWY